MLHFRLKELMKEKAVTYRQVSDGAEVSTNTVYKLVKDKQKMIGLDVLERLLDYFDCDLNELIVIVPDNEGHQPNPALSLAADVYAGLSPDQIDEIEQIALDRRDFFGEEMQ